MTSDVPVVSDTRVTPRLEIPGRLLLRNTLLNLAGQGVPLVVVLLTVPFLIAHLGEDRFGILAVIWVIMNCSSTFDLGLGRAIRKLVAEALGRGDQTRVAGLIGSALIVQIASGTFGGLLLVAFTPLLTERILHIPPELQDEARATFYLLAGAIPVVVVSESLFGVLEAAQRFDLVNFIKVPFFVSAAIVPVVGVALGVGLPGIAALLLLSMGVILIVQYVLCARVFPELRRVPRLRRAQLRELLGFGGWIIISNAINPILTYVERLAIGMVLTMAAVTLYTGPSEMVMRLSLLPASLAATLFPAFSTLSGQGRSEVLQSFATRSVKYLMLILGPTVLLTAAYGREILELWLGPPFASESVLVLQILAVGVFANALASVPYSVVHALGRPDITAKFHLLELAIHCVLVWALVTFWGIPGAALAWTIRVGLDAALLFAASAHLSRLPLRAFVAGRVLQAGAMLAALGLVAVVVTALDAPLWVRVGAPLFLSAAAAGAMWAYLLDAEDRAHALGIFGIRRRAAVLPIP